MMVDKWAEVLVNRSALHWDMIFDLRKGGSIHADGELIVKDGAFVREEWR